MNKKKIAVTGGIGSGKSTLLNYIKEKGYSVFSCDEIYSELCLSSEYIKKLEAIFPEVIEEGTLDREALSRIVFTDKSKRNQLNELAHPIIMRMLFEKMEKAKGEIVFAEVPLLFEGNYQDEFDGVIILKRSEDKRICSVVKRDNTNVDKVKKRIQSQFNYSKTDQILLKNNNNYYIIENEGTLQDLQNCFDEIVKQM